MHEKLKLPAGALAFSPVESLSSEVIALQAAACFDAAWRNESRSLLITSAWVVGIPCGKPG
jgi:hypothetical protein